MGSARYASPKAGGTLYQEPYYDNTWYTSPNAYAPQSSALTYHQVGHPQHLGPTHEHEHYSPNVTHMETHLAQVCNTIYIISNKF